MKRQLIKSVLGAAAIAAASALAPTVSAEPTVTAQAADAGALVDEGKDLYRAKDYAQAADRFEKARELDATLVDAHRGLGRSLEKLGEYEQAEAAYLAMREALPDETAALKRLGIVYRKLERYEDSVRAYRDYASAVPDDPDPWYGLGESLAEMGDKVGAMKAFEKYAELETRPDEQKYVERAKERAADIQAELDAAAAEPDEPEAVANLGEKTVTMPEEGAAADRESVAPTPPPESVGVLSGEDVRPAEDWQEAVAAGDLSFSQGQHKHAATRYLAAHLAAPEAAEPAYKLGVALAVAGDEGRAIDAWEAALRADPDLEVAARNIERARRKLAVDAVVDAPGMTDAAEAGARRQLAVDYLAAGRYHMALRAAEALLAVAPEDPDAYRLAALSHLGLADAAEAISMLETELAISPSDPDLYRLMGEAHELMDSAEQAAYFYDLYVAAVDPDGTDEAMDEYRARIEALGGEG